ncbi:MAG: dihydrodipicolinate synthase family protein, partial [Thermoguttaceae bacterium]|nr:dihydrodipicolinate synthase family protein [Thermoguttaceae bacterium]
MPKPSTVTARREIVGRMFPNGLPALWCPTLTHFLRDGALDVPRIRRHLQFIAPHVKGILVPGSTGEGWEMNDAEVRELVPVVLDAASELGIKVLVGVLKVRADE